MRIILVLLAMLPLGAMWYDIYVKREQQAREETFLNTTEGVVIDVLNAPVDQELVDPIVLSPERNEPWSLHGKLILTESDSGAERRRIVAQFDRVCDRDDDIDCWRLLRLTVDGQPRPIDGSGDPVTTASTRGVVPEPVAALERQEQTPASQTETLPPSPAGALSAEPLPAEPVPAQPLPAQPLPAQPLPAETLPAEALPAEALPAEAATEETATAVTAMAPGDPPVEIAQAPAETEAPASPAATESAASIAGGGSGNDALPLAATGSVAPAPAAESSVPATPAPAAAFSIPLAPESDDQPALAEAPAPSADPAPDSANATAAIKAGTAIEAGGEAIPEPAPGIAPEASSPQRAALPAEPATASSETMPDAATTAEDRAAEASAPETAAEDTAAEDTAAEDAAAEASTPETAAEDTAAEDTAEVAEAEAVASDTGDEAAETEASDDPEIPYADPALVSGIQSALNALGYGDSRGLSVDGVLGPQTRDAIRSYRRQHALEEQPEVSEALLAHMAAKVESETSSNAGANGAGATGTANPGFTARTAQALSAPTGSALTSTASSPTGGPGLATRTANTLENK